MDNSSKERREHVRIYRNFILTFYEKGKVKIRNEVSQVNNVSRGGMSFSSTQALKPGAVMIVDLQTPFIADSIQLEGIVLECKEKIPEIIYEIRLQFQEISKEAIVYLEKIESYAKLKKG